VQYEAFLNPALHAASGAGIQAVQLIANKSEPPPHRGWSRAMVITVGKVKGEKLEKLKGLEKLDEEHFHMRIRM